MRKEYFNVYKYDELSDKSKEKAYELWVNMSDSDYDWHNQVLEEWEERLEKYGFINTKIFYSGFWSQGDGASFNADIDLRILAYEWAISEIIDTENENIFPFLDFIEDDSIGSTLKICVIGGLSNHYSHEKTRYIETDGNGYEWNESGPEPSWIEPMMNELIDYVEEVRLCLCQEIYSSLRDEYDYLISEESFKESIESNEYEFRENGRIF